MKMLWIIQGLEYLGQEQQRDVDKTTAALDDLFFSLLYLKKWKYAVGGALLQFL